MNSRLKLAALALCATPLLLAQNDQSKNASPPAATQPDGGKPQATATPSPQAQPPAPAASKASATAPAEQPRPNIQLAADDAKNRTAERYIGWRVKSSNRDELGKVKDFLIDTQTGKADFALISSGGIAGLGDKLRLVPAAALKRIGESKDFMLEISKDRWETLATVDEHELKSGPLTIPDAQRREIDRHFEHSTGTTQDSGFYSAGITAHLVRASELGGREVRSGNDRLGKIEAVVLDLDSGAANALVEPNKSFTGMKQKLLVPFSALNVGDGKRPQVSTLISRADFQQLRSGNPAPAPTASAVAASTPAESRATAQASSEKAKVTTGIAAAGQSSEQTSPTGRNEPPPSGANRDMNEKSKVATQETPAQPKTSSPSEPPKTDQAGRIATSDQPAATKDENRTTPAEPHATAQPGSEKEKAAAGVAAAGQSTEQTSPTGRNEPPSSGANRDLNEKSKVATQETPAQPKTSSPAEPPKADQAGRVAASEKPAATKDENLTPTGRNSADTIPAGTDPALLATARAIRKALDDDPELASADVRVTPEQGGKIALRGRVSDQKTKTAIVETATREIKGWKIDDQISVENR